MFILVVTDGKVLFVGQRLFFFFFVDNLVLVRDMASLFIPEKSVYSANGSGRGQLVGC